MRSMVEGLFSRLREDEDLAFSPEWAPGGASRVAKRASDTKHRRPQRVERRYRHSYRFTDGSDLDRNGNL